MHRPDKQTNNSDSGKIVFRHKQHGIIQQWIAFRLLGEFHLLWYCIVSLSLSTVVVILFSSEKTWKKCFCWYFCGFETSLLIWKTRFENWRLTNTIDRMHSNYEFICNGSKWCVLLSLVLVISFFFRISFLLHLWCKMANWMFRCCKMKMTK